MILYDSMKMWKAMRKFFNDDYRMGTTCVKKLFQREMQHNEQLGLERL